MTAAVKAEYVGRGKVILLGEHAVVYGRPALAAGLDRGVRVRMIPSDEMVLAIPAWDREVTLSDRDELGRAFAAVIGQQPVTSPMRLEAEVSLPDRAGLGCSAALGVAVVRALANAATGKDQEVAERALAWERVFHGKPSGIDNTMAAVGGVACYRKGWPLQRLRLPTPMWLVVGNSGKPTATREMVEGVAARYARDPDATERVFDSIGVLVEQAIPALEAGNLAEFGRLMDANQIHLEELQLSTPALQEMCEAARAAGALGAKLTGAGGGGSMVAIVADARTGARVCDAIRRIGQAAFVTEVG